MTTDSQQVAFEVFGVGHAWAPSIDQHTLALPQKGGNAASHPAVLLRERRI